MKQINKNQYGQKYQKERYKIMKIGIAFKGLQLEMAWEEEKN